MGGAVEPSRLTCSLAFRRGLPGPVFGVERGLSGRRWVWRTGEDRVAFGIAQRLEVPEIVGRLLAARGIGIEAAAAFLEPTLRALLPDPSLLIDMDAAAERLADAVAGGADGRRVRRLRRRWRVQRGADGDLAARHGLHRRASRAGPDARGLRPEWPGAAGAGGEGRPADRLRRLRHRGGGGAGGAGRAGGRRSCWTTTSPRGRRRRSWRRSIRTGWTAAPG